MSDADTRDEAGAETSPDSTGDDQEADEPATFDQPYHKWGWCEKCGDRVPPAGAVIGFFGKQDVCPRWCRECVIKYGDAELLEIWDEAVNTETKRRADRKAQKRQAQALTGG